MNYLLVENLTKSFGIRSLFQDITFGLQKGQKVALVARNGTGKSTLLNIIAGLDSPDSGQVVIRNGVSKAYLSQVQTYNPELTVWEAIFQQKSPITDAMKAYELALHQFEQENNEDTETKLNDAMHDMDRLGAWDFEAKVKQVLSKLKLDDFEAKIQQLSGGQIKRVALASVLLSEPELLIMDEPTNHLDIEMIEWLEDYLSSKNTTVLMVTHDRYFLDNVCNAIYEMDNNSIFQYNGDYSYFIQKKAEREAITASEVDKARNLYTRELEWVRKMPKARGTKSKSRLDAFEEVKEKAFSLRKSKEIDMNMRMKRMGNKIVELIKVSKEFENKKLFDQFTYSFRKGERIGIVGSNGSGKSTLLNMITGKDEPTSGKVIVGDTIEFGYYHQQGMKLKEDLRVIEVMKEIAEVIEMDKNTKLTASQLLQRFDFTSEMQWTPVSKLSGGEKRRLYLLTVLVRNPNFLILDEPTNDLDILTLNKLEEFLLEFGGCMIIVSHDRYFMDKLVDQIFVFEKGNLSVFGGNYTQYRLAKEIEEEERKLKQQQVQQAVQVEVAAPDKKKEKLSYKEKLEFDKLEGELEALENEKNILNEKLASGLTDHEELMTTTNRLAEVTSSLDFKTDRWLYLSEFV